MNQTMVVVATAVLLAGYASGSRVYETPGVSLVERDGDRAVRVLAAGVLVLASVAPALAQQVEVEKHAPGAPAAEPRVIAPPLRYEITKPSDHDFYDRDMRVPYDPAFIGPMSTEYTTRTQSGRMGMSGWTAPNTPVGSPGAGGTGFSEVNGWFAFGFSMTWGGVPPPVNLVR